MSFSRRLVRTLARRAVYPLVELITVVLLLLRAALRGRRSEARPLDSKGGQRVLVVAAHPDDETIGCAGAMLLHGRAGDAVRVLIVTDGSGSRAGGLPSGEMAARRRSEVLELAAQFDGLDVSMLDYPEGGPYEQELASLLSRELRYWKPDIVYAPSCVDFHPEHIRVARILAGALDSASGDRPRVRAYEMQVPLGIELTNLFISLDADVARKARAIEVYRSQRGALDLWRRQARYLAGLYGVPRGAEAFWEISPRGYRGIMAYADWDWRTTPFRSLSGRPFGDFFAHVRGRETRLRLRRLAEGDQ
jgi:LmbE family N-acetylglucosaminyl deacetylase